MVLTRLGLANRLRTMSDWYNIALIQNRTMLVNWVPTLDCNAAYFTDLFEVGSLPRFKSSSKLSWPLDFFRLTIFFLLVLPLPFTEIRWEFLLSQSLQALQSERNISHLNIDNANNLTFLLSQLTLESFDSYQILVTTYDGVITTSLTPCIKHLVKHSEFLSSLVPLPFIRNVVKEVKDKYFSKSIMIGIHCKLYSNTSSWVWFAQNFGEGATVEVFISTMTKI